MIYFTSDLHLFHANILRFCNRPFADVEDMNKTLINNIKNTLQPNDSLYFLGDIGFNHGCIKTVFKDILYGYDIKFILGGHDRQMTDLIETYFENEGPVCERTFQYQGKDYPITMSHYPMVTFNKSHYGSWNLYGHHHSKHQDDIINKMCPGKRMNVGVDLNNFMPVSLAMVVEHMKSMPDNWDILK